MRNAAVNSWPILCITPPAMLTPMTENRPVFFNPIMTKILNMPPMRENIMPDTPENRSPLMIILRIFTAKADFASNEYKTKIIAKFAIPSFAPGIPTLIGRRASM